MNRLSGKVALITGGAMGMGAAFAKAFVAEGAKVIIADLAVEAGQNMADSLGADNALFVALDVTDADAWQAAVEAATARFGKLNVLVNSAGVFITGPLAKYARSDWDKTLAINLTGPFIGLRAALPALTASAPASVINISSTAGLQGYAGYHAYCASKWGLRGLTRSAALELAKRNIRVNCVFPGGVATPMTAAFQDNQDILKSMNPLERYAQPEEIANLLVYLASDESAFCTGGEFVIDGGHTAGPKT